MGLGSLMMKWFLKNYPDSEVISLSGEEIENIKLLAETKYRTWEWNYGYGPEYHFKNRIVYNGKEIILRLFVKDGIIRECEMKGSDRAVFSGRKTCWLPAYAGGYSACP